MPQRKLLPVQAFVCFVLGECLAYESRPLVGLDLVEDNTAEMIESMKADMSINFMEVALLQSVAQAGGAGGGDLGDEARANTVVFPSYSLTDADGVVHTCTVRQKPNPAPQSGGKSAVSSTNINTYTNTDVSAALDPLEGSCATLSHGYWSYKWCHRKEVIQFHEDDSSMTVISLGRHTKTEVKRAGVNPTADVAESSAVEFGASASDASAAKRERGKEGEAEKVVEGLVQKFKKSDSVDELGGKKRSWVSSLLKKKRKADSSGGGGPGSKSDVFHGINDVSELAAIFDFYEGGDVCDETGANRSLKTAITCCTTHHVAADGKASNPLAVLVSIQEVSLCSYLVQVCSRLLCPAVMDENTPHGQWRRKQAAAPNGVAVASVGHRVGGVMGILRELGACFPPKKDSWWSYRLCFSTGITQYHEDLFRKADGGLVSKVTDEYSLGAWDDSAITGDGEELIRHDEAVQETGGTIVLEFIGGTECDLTGVLRSSTVHLKCGSQQEVRDVTEDRTCHYRVLAYSPLLCSHPALMPKKAAVRTVDCVPDHKKNRGEKKNGKRPRKAGMGGHQVENLTSTSN